MHQTILLHSSMIPPIIWFKLDFLLPRNEISVEHYSTLMGLYPLENLQNCPPTYPIMFSTDFIFRQQENLVDNQICQAGSRQLCNKILR